MADEALEKMRAMMPPFAKHMGVTLTKATPDLIEAEMTVLPEHCTVGDRVHGGAVMSLADNLGAVGAFLNLAPDAKGTTTIESKTNFLGSVKAGAKLVARCEPLHRGRRSQVWQTRIEDGSGSAVAVVIQTQLTL